MAKFRQIWSHCRPQNLQKNPPKIAKIVTIFYLGPPRPLFLDIFTNEWQIVESIKSLKSVECKLGIRTWGHRSRRLEDTDESTETWRTHSRDGLYNDSLCYAYFKLLDWLSIFFNQSDCIIFMYTIICLKGVCKGSIVKEGMKESSWIGMIYDTFGM